MAIRIFQHYQHRVHSSPESNLYVDGRTSGSAVAVREAARRRHLNGGASLLLERLLQLSCVGPGGVERERRKAPRNALPARASSLDSRPSSSSAAATPVPLGCRGRPVAGVERDEVGERYVVRVALQALRRGRRVRVQTRDQVSHTAACTFGIARVRA